MKLKEATLTRLREMPLPALVITLVASLFLAVFSEASAQVSPHTSRLVLKNSRPNANGQAQAFVQLELKDETGSPVPGKKVTLLCDNSAFVLIQPLPTDLDGLSTATVTSTKIGLGEVWGTVDGENIFPNLIENPSFELGSVTPSHWSGPNEENLNFFLWEPRAGEFGKVVGIQGSQDSGFSWFQKVESEELVPGTSYNLSALFRTTTGYPSDNSFEGVALSLWHENSSENLISFARIIATATAQEWRTIEISKAVFPEGAARVQVSLENSGEGTAFFDDVRLCLSPAIQFGQDLSSPAAITTSSPTLLTAIPGANNGELDLRWKASGNDGYLWPNPKGHYNIKISENYLSLPISSWTSVTVPFAPARPGTDEHLAFSGLVPGTTYQLAIQVCDQSQNCSDFALTRPLPAKSGTNPITLLTVDQKVQLPGKLFSSRPAFSGKTRPGCIVTVRIDGSEEGETASEREGNWKYALQKSLDEGSHFASIRADDLNGNASEPVEFSFQVGSSDPFDQVKKIYPNPVIFSKGQRCHFEFSVITKSKVRLRIFDNQHRELKSLSNEDYPLGVHTLSWDGRDDNGTELPSNSYFLLFETERQNQILPFTVLR